MIIEIVLGLFILIEGYIIWNLTKKSEILENIRKVTKCIYHVTNCVPR